MDPSKRLERLLFYLKISSRKLSQDIGLSSAQAFYNIKKNRNGFSPELARLICQAYPKLNYEWLIAGKGEMLRPMERAGESPPEAQGEGKTGVCAACEALKSQAQSLESRLSDKDEMLRMKEGQAEAFERMLADKDKQIEDLKGSMERLISSKDEMLAMKDEAIKGKEEQIKAFEGRIEDLKSNMNLLLLSKDELIEELKSKPGKQKILKAA